MAEYVIPNERFKEVDKDGDGDSNLCWLASACSALWLSDWANNKIFRDKNNGAGTEDYQAFQNPTEVFKYAKQAFSNTGGLAWRGMTWWIANSYPLDPETDPNYGGFYYLSAREAMDFIYTVTPENFLSLLSDTYGKLDEYAEYYAGLPAGTLGVIFSTSTNAPSSTTEVGNFHEVPLWGYRVSDEDETTPLNITAFQISDPDNDANTRFWIPVSYDPKTHWYKETYTTASSTDVPSSWSTNAWIQTLSVILPRPVEIRHIRGLTNGLSE